MFRLRPKVPRKSYSGFLALDRTRPEAGHDFPIAELMDEDDPPHVTPGSRSMAAPTVGSLARVAIQGRGPGRMGRRPTAQDDPGHPGTTVAAIATRVFNDLHRHGAPPRGQSGGPFGTGSCRPRDRPREFPRPNSPRGGLECDRSDVGLNLEAPAPGGHGPSGKTETGCRPWMTRFWRPKRPIRMRGKKRECRTRTKKFPRIRQAFGRKTKIPAMDLGERPASGSAVWSGL